MEEFYKLWKEHEKELLYFIKAGTYQMVDMEDIFQDVANLAYQAWPSLPNRDGNLKAWLFTIARNRLKRYYQEENRRNNNHMYVDTAAMESLLVQYESISLDGMVIADFLKNLPSKWRVILHMNLYQGYSARQIAKMTGISAGAISKRITRTKKLLVKTLEEDSR